MTDQNYRLRPYQPSDAAGLWEILAPPIRAGETFALPRDMDAADAVAFWSGGDRQCFVAERDGELLGSSFIKPNQAGGGGHVANGGYATRPEARGQGVARALCLQSLQVATAQGFRMMQFNFVISTNLSALTLWQRCGFEIVGRLPEAFLHPRLGYVDALIMVKRL